VVKDNDAIHVASGYMPQRFGLYEDLSVMENMRLYAQLRGMDADRNADLFAELLDFTRLGPFTKRLAGKLSGGMKQKLGLACALMARPKVLLLDEPGVGVDPVSRQDLWRMVQALTDEGMAVVWSTAYLDEAERCESVLLLNQGQLLFDGPPQRADRAARRPQLPSGRRRRRAPGGADRGTRSGKRERWRDPGRRRARGAARGRGKRADPALADRARVQLARCPRVSKTPSSIFSVAAPAAHRRSPRACRRSNWVRTLPFPAAISPSASAISPPPTTSASRCAKAKSSACSGPMAPANPPPSRCCAACSNPPAGEAQVVGHDLRRATGAAKSRLGYMAQKFSLYGLLSVRQNLEFSAGVYGLEGNTRRERIEEMIETFDLGDWLSATPDSLPLGHKQRLALACSLMHRPPVLFLDEPTSGVDPITRREFWTHINGLARKGVTIMVTTHFMDEAEYCDRVAMLSRPADRAGYARRAQARRGQ
jgi:ABC-2 type transport system ATP-binding protein